MDTNSEEKQGNNPKCRASEPHTENTSQLRGVIHVKCHKYSNKYEFEFTTNCHLKIINNLNGYECELQDLFSLCCCDDTVITNPTVWWREWEWQEHSPLDNKLLLFQQTLAGFDQSVPLSRLRLHRRGIQRWVLTHSCIHQLQRKKEMEKRTEEFYMERNIWFANECIFSQRTTFYRNS